MELAVLIEYLYVVPALVPILVGLLRIMWR